MEITAMSVVAAANVHYHVAGGPLQLAVRRQSQRPWLAPQEKLRWARARYAESCTARFSTGVISLGNADDDSRMH